MWHVVCVCDTSRGGENSRLTGGEKSKLVESSTDRQAEGSPCGCGPGKMRGDETGNRAEARSHRAFSNNWYFFLKLFFPMQ